MAIMVGLDIGGTKFMVAGAQQDGRLLKQIKETTPLDRDTGLNLLHHMIESVTGGEKIASIGAAIGGPLDWQRGIVSPLHQPEWRHVPLKAIMEKKWNCPFQVDVDTNVAALGEYTFGNERASRFLYMTISTGIGGGFLIDGQIYRGQDQKHPEIGHQAIPYRCSYPERIECECGADYCVEALISGNGIRRIYRKPAEELNDEEWQQVAYNLGQALRNLAAIYCPDVIVLGGGVAVGGGEPILAQARKIMQANLKIVPCPVVRLSHLGYDTALKGSIALAQRALK